MRGVSVGSCTLSCLEQSIREGRSPAVRSSSLSPDGGVSLACLVSRLPPTDVKAKVKFRKTTRVWNEYGARLSPGGGPIRFLVTFGRRSTVRHVRRIAHQDMKWFLTILWSSMVAQQ